MKMRTQSNPNPHAQRIRQMSNQIIKSTEQDLQRAASILRDDELRVSKHHQRLSRAAEQQVAISQQMNQRYEGQRELLKQKAQANQMNLKCSSTSTRYRFNPELDMHQLQHSQYEPQDIIFEGVVTESKEYFLPEQQQVSQQQQISDEEEIKEQQKEETRILANQELQQKSDALEAQQEQIQSNPNIQDDTMQVAAQQEQNALPVVVDKHLQQSEQRNVREQSVCADPNSTNFFTQQESFSAIAKDNQFIQQNYPISDKNLNDCQKSTKTLDNEHMAQQTSVAFPISPDTASKFNEILKTRNHTNMQMQNQWIFHPSSEQAQDVEQLNLQFTHSATPHHLIGSLRRSEVQDCNILSSSPNQNNKLCDNQQCYYDQITLQNFKQPTNFGNNYDFSSSNHTQRDKQKSIIQQLKTQLPKQQLIYQSDEQRELKLYQYNQLSGSRESIPQQADTKHVLNQSLSTEPVPNQNNVRQEQVIIQKSLSKEYQMMPSNIFSTSNVNDVLEQSKQITQQRQKSSLSSVQDKVLDSIISDNVAPQNNKTSSKQSNIALSQQQTQNIVEKKQNSVQSDVPLQFLPNQQNYKSNLTNAMKSEEQYECFIGLQEDLTKVDTYDQKLLNQPEQKQQIYELSPNSLRNDLEVQIVVDDPLVNPFVSPQLNEQKPLKASAIHQTPNTQAFGFQVYCQMEELQLLQEGFQKRLWDHGLSQDVVDNLGQNDVVVFNQISSVQDVPVLELEQPEQDQQDTIKETTNNVLDRRLQHKQNMETLKKQQALIFPHSIPKDSKQISVQEAQAIILKNKLAASKYTLQNKQKPPTIIHKKTSGCDPNYYIERNKQIVKSIDNESKYCQLNHSSARATQDFGNNISSFPIPDSLQSFNNTDFSEVDNILQPISDQISSIQHNEMNKYVLRNIEESKTYKSSVYFSQLDNYVQSQKKFSPCKNYNEKQKHFALSQGFKQRVTPIGIELVTSKRSDLENFYPQVTSGVQLDYAVLDKDFQYTMDSDSMINQPIDKDVGFAHLEEIQPPRSSTPVHQLNRKIYQLAQKNDNQQLLHVSSPTKIMQSQSIYVPKTPEFYHLGVSQMNASKTLINDNLSYLKTMQFTQNEIIDSQQQVLLLMTGDPQYTLQHYDEVQVFAEELIQSQINY